MRGCAEDTTYFEPFFQAVFSGYTLFWVADERFGPQMMTLVPRTYGDMTNASPCVRIVF